MYYHIYCFFSPVADILAIVYTSVFMYIKHLHIAVIHKAFDVCEDNPDNREMQSIRDWLYKQWIPCKHQLRSAPTAQNGMSSAALKHDVRRHPALCCGSVGFQLTVCVVSAGCNGLSNGTLLQGRVVKWPSAPVWHSRSHSTPPEDHWAVSHFRAVAWCFPRCKRGGLVGEDAKNSLTAWLGAPGCLLRDLHLNTERLNHSGTTGSLCSQLWMKDLDPVRGLTVCN